MATQLVKGGCRRDAAARGIYREARVRSPSAYSAITEPVADSRRRTPCIFSRCRSVLRRYRSATERFSARQNLRVKNLQESRQARHSARRWLRRRSRIGAAPAQVRSTVDAARLLHAVTARSARSTAPEPIQGTARRRAPKD